MELDVRSSDTQSAEGQSSDRRSSHVRLLRENDSTHNHLLALLLYVRDSGKFNMLTEARDALFYAIVFGVYVGLLSFPADFYADVFNRLQQLYLEYIGLYKEKPREYAILEDAARLLPSGFTYNTIAEEFATLFPNAALPSIIEPRRALDLAYFVLRWIGKQIFLDDVKRWDRERAQRMRDRYLRWPMPLDARAGHNSDEDVLYGLARFREFLQEPGRAALVEQAAEHEFAFRISLADTLALVLL